MDTTERVRLRALRKGIALPWEAMEDYGDDDEAMRMVVLCPHGDTDDRDTVATVDMGHDEECDRAHAALIVGAVNALGPLLDDLDAADARAEKAERERDEARAEAERHCQDIADAAGELLVDIPEPGTEKAKLLRANVLMRRERDEVRAIAAALAEAEIATRMQVERALRGEPVNDPRCDAVILAARVVAELAEARAEAERLRRELAEARGDFVQMREDRDACKGALARANDLRIGDRAEARLDEREACAAVAARFADGAAKPEARDVARAMLYAIRARGEGGGA